MTPQELSADIYAKVKELQNEVQEAMQRMENIASLPYLSWFNFSQTPTFEPQRAGVISIADLPKLKQALLNIDLSNDSLEKYRSHIWQGADLDTLQNKLMEYVQTSGVGIEQAVQDAIFNQGRERDLQAMRDAMDLAGARTGAKGCRYPTSMTKALQREVLTTYQNNKNDLNREIVKTIADLAQKNVQLSIQAGISIEQLHSDFAIKFSALSLDNSRLIIEKFRVEQEAYIAEFEGTLRGILANLEVEKVNGTLELGYQENLRQKWQIEANILLEKGKAQIQQAEQANVVKIEAAKTVAATAMGTMTSLSSNAVSVIQERK
ncbi:hypothetical protein [Geotalea sp. SG265]|uniref:hypothetical protein n=1 Tax=Geotalea sp. SG265 TaxID=2922867 RepID=UPI001FB005D6|nr:hypothetical protein [Geotalea sp. SG265]